MNIILFTNVHGRPGSLNLNRPTFYVPALLLVLLLLAAAVAAGYRLGLAMASRPARAELAAVKNELARQQQALHSLQRRARAGLDTLSQRLGRLQAEAMRLDALGNTLVDMAGLDKGEFDFDHEPAVGGPLSPQPETEVGLAELWTEMTRLDRLLDDRRHQLGALESLISSRNLKRERYPAGRPVARGWISSGFGQRTDPFTGRKSMHEGIDFAGRLGTRVVAVAAGVVTWAGARGGYGNLVEIDHGNGYVTRYGHNMKILVKVGEMVRKGQPIALMGSTGRSTGPHVHFEVLRHGRPVNPAPFVHKKG